MFEIDKSLFYYVNKNLLTCAIYAQPITSIYYSDEIWNKLEIDLLNLTTNETPFCIIGDMNGRVGEWSEFPQPDKHVDINYNNNITRSISESSMRNCDKQTNKIGENVIHLCKSYDIQVANGRTRGD